MKRKLSAFLLSLFMAFSMLPTAALAAESACYEVLLEPTLRLTTMDSEFESTSGGIKYACGDVIITLQTNQGNSPMGLMNTKGEMLVEYGIYDSINEFRYGYSPVQKGKEYGIIDTSGNEVIPLGIYDFVWPVSENRFQVYVHDETGVIDLEGNFIIPVGKYKDFNHYSEASSVLLTQNDEGFLLVDLDGNELSAVYKRMASPDDHGNFPVQFKDGSYGMIDSQGNTLVNSREYEVFSSLGDYFVVWDDNYREGVMDSQGNFVAEFGTYDFWIIQENSGIIFDDDCVFNGLLNENLEEVIPLGNYTFSFSPFQDGLVFAYLVSDNSYSNQIVLDANGNERDYLSRYRNETYDRADLFYSLRDGSGYFLVRQWKSNSWGIRYGVIDIYGNEIFAPGEFDSFVLSDTNVLWAGKNGVWGAYQLPEVDWEGFVNGTAANPSQSETPAETEPPMKPEQPEIPAETETPVNPEQPEIPTFADVDADDWYFEAVEYVSSNGLMSGTGNEQFSPDSTTTRGMLMTILARMNGVDTSGGTVWYEKGTMWAKEQGISDGTNPDGSITREQLAAMLYRYMGSPTVSGSLDSFADSSKVSSYAESAMCWAVENSLISGMGDGTLNPQGNATRAQVATILMRFCNNLAK